MVREALFDILAGRAAGAAVLDAFAGSGALALEALSRGAASAVMVDHSAKAAKAIRGNIESVGAGDRARLINAPWARARRLLKDEGARFDLILLDPPYGWPDAAGLLEESIALAAPGAWIALEHGRGAAIDAPDGLAFIKTRVYGVTALSFYEVLDGGLDSGGSVSREG
jgi:16S rRNA (guanine966-N2)-methyltransferase